MNNHLNVALYYFGRMVFLQESMNDTRANTRKKNEQGNYKQLSENHSTQREEIRINHSITFLSPLP